MKKLMYKEFVLAIHPMVWFFCLMSLMVFIPNYPSTVFLIYLMMCFIFLFQTARENNDDIYSASLPIRKRDTVRARFGSIIIFQGISVIIGLASCLIINFCLIGEGTVYGEVKQMGPGIGIATTPAFIGLMLIALGIFNIVFLVWHYKKGQKMLVPMIVSTIIGVLLCALIEVAGSFANSGVDFLVNMSYQLNHMTLDTLGTQLILLGCGIIVYAVLTYLAYIKSAKQFEALDL